jgi:hypothetical protein
MPKKFLHQKVLLPINTQNTLATEGHGGILEAHRSILKRFPDIIRKLLID